MTGFPHTSKNWIFKKNHFLIADLKQNDKTITQSDWIQKSTFGKKVCLQTFSAKISIHQELPGQNHSWKLQIKI